MSGIHILFNDDPVVTAGEIYADRTRTSLGVDETLFALHLNRVGLSKDDADVDQEIARAENAAVDHLLAAMDEFRECSKWQWVVEQLMARGGICFDEIVKCYIPNGFGSELSELKAIIGAELESIDDTTNTTRMSFADSILIDAFIAQQSSYNKTRGYQMLATLLVTPPHSSGHERFIQEILSDKASLDKGVRQLYLLHLEMLHENMGVDRAGVEQVVDNYLNPRTTRAQKREVIRDYLHRSVGIDDALPERIQTEIRPLPQQQLQERTQTIDRTEKLLERLGRDYPEYGRMLDSIGVEIHLCDKIDNEIKLGRSGIHRRRIELLSTLDEENAYSTLLEEVTHYLDGYIGFSKNPVFKFPENVQADLSNPNSIITMFMERWSYAKVQGPITGGPIIKRLPWHYSEGHIDQEWLVDMQAVERMLRKAKNEQDLHFSVTVKTQPLPKQLPNGIKPSLTMLGPVYRMIGQYQYPLSDTDVGAIMAQLFPYSYRGLVDFRVEVERENVKLQKIQRVNAEEALLHEAVASGEAGGVHDLLRRGISSDSLNRLCDMVADIPSLSTLVQATRSLFTMLSGLESPSPTNLNAYTTAAVLDARIDNRTFAELATEKMNAASRREDFLTAATMRDWSKRVNVGSAIPASAQR